MSRVYSTFSGKTRSRTSRCACRPFGLFTTFCCCSRRWFLHNILFYFIMLHFQHTKSVGIICGADLETRDRVRALYLKSRAGQKTGKTPYSLSGVFRYYKSIHFSPYKRYVTEHEIFLDVFWKKKKRKNQKNRYYSLFTRPVITHTHTHNTPVI